MSNIERRYSYHDDGVLPSEGEYGVTYLTLYSSGAGNHYDGWMWDPDRVHYSETERTFGYRNPDYPDYCWDDEVVVDLSNAQARQETSDFAQGRITSFNTNVSDQPILLQDIDITGLNEEEREARATTVLFSAIPLVKDAYIQAMIEVQMKANLSPDNTNGMMRVEAFYILNDESDRTMRPNPVHTFAVATQDERHTLPWLYWNPALSHEDHNYIGVKLLCTGGTAEIGISDNPEYGDAIITLTSAGLVGDHIDDNRTAVALTLYGRDLVPYGHRLNPNEYTVLCTYDTGEIYDVTRLCDFSPEMQTKVLEPIVLTASYAGLTASLDINLSELIYMLLYGIDPLTREIVPDKDFAVSYTLNVNDFQVIGTFEDGTVDDITESCTFTPEMGTTITSDTTLIAYCNDPVSHTVKQSNEYHIRKYSRRSSGDPKKNLIYTVYPDRTATITGHIDDSIQFEDDGEFRYERYAVSSSYLVETGRYDNMAAISSPEMIGYASMRPNPYAEISYPTANQLHYCGTAYYFRKCSEESPNGRYIFDIYGTAVNPQSSVPYDSFYPSRYIYVRPNWDWADVDSVEWKATGKPLGLCFWNNDTGIVNRGPVLGTQFIHFDRMDTSHLISMRNAFRECYADVSFLNTMSFPALVDMRNAFTQGNPSSLTRLDAENLVSLDSAFSKATASVNSNLTFTSTHVKYLSNIFAGSTVNTNPMKYSGWSGVLNTVEHMDAAFEKCTLGANFELGSLVTPNLKTADLMFATITFYRHTSFIGEWNRCDSLESIKAMFANAPRNTDTAVQNGNMTFDGFVSFFSTIPSGVDMSFMFYNYRGSDLSYMMGANSWNHIIDYMFYACSAIRTLYGLSSIGSRCKSAIGTFYNCYSMDISAINNWDMGSCENIRCIFYRSNSGGYYGESTINYGEGVGGWNTQSIRNVAYAFYHAGAGKTIYSAPYEISGLYLLNNWRTDYMENDYQMVNSNYPTISETPKYTWTDEQGVTHVEFMTDGEGHTISVRLIPWWQNSSHRT